jgi:hypothetical protein
MPCPPASKRPPSPPSPNHPPPPAPALPAPSGSPPSQAHDHLEQRSPPLTPRLSPPIPQHPPSPERPPSPPIPQHPPSPERPPSPPIPQHPPSPSLSARSEPGLCSSSASDTSEVSPPCTLRQAPMLATPLPSPRYSLLSPSVPALTPSSGSSWCDDLGSAASHIACATCAGDGNEESSCRITMGETGTEMQPCCTPPHCHSTTVPLSRAHGIPQQHIDFVPPRFCIEWAWSVVYSGNPNACMHPHHHSHISTSSG